MPPKAAAATKTNLIVLPPQRRAPPARRSSPRPPAKAGAHHAGQHKPRRAPRRPGHAHPHVMGVKFPSEIGSALAIQAGSIITAAYADKGQVAGFAPPAMLIGYGELCHDPGAVKIGIGAGLSQALAATGFTGWAAGKLRQFTDGAGKKPGAKGPDGKPAVKKTAFEEAAADAANVQQTADAASSLWDDAETLL